MTGFATSVGNNTHHQATRQQSSSTRDVMAIGFLAPQDNSTEEPTTTTTTTSQSRTAAVAAVHQIAAQQGSDVVVTSNSRPQQLEALAYGVNVEASLNARLYVSSSPPQHQQHQQQHQPTEAYSYAASLSSSAGAAAGGISSSVSSPLDNTTPSTSPKHDDSSDGQPSSASSRERRDPYSEEMQFFIMFARIIKELDWRKIEDEFEGFFGQRRPRDGLTAVYYRIRLRWGMPQVLKSNGADKCHDDAKFVYARARTVSSHFLSKIGYAHASHQYRSAGG